MAVTSAESGATLLPKRDDGQLVERGGEAGAYFYFRSAEILVNVQELARIAGERGRGAPAAVDPTVDAIVNSVMTPGNAGWSNFDDSARSVQRRDKRRRPAPFGIAVHQVPTGVDVAAVITALNKLRVAGGPWVAGYNYVTAPTPMRSHAVSYAEPASLTDVTFVDDDQAGRGVRIAVLDTGRPVYGLRFKEYFAERQLSVPRSAGNPSGFEQAYAGGNPLDRVDQIFPPAPFGFSRPIGEQQDTMVTEFGRLAHPHAGHGLFVGSIIAWHAPGAALVAETTMSADAIGDWYDMLVDIAHALDLKCDLLNISMGFHTADGLEPPGMDVVADVLSAAGAKLVASAGNDGSERPMWPAAHDEVVAVAARGADGAPTEWSNFGDWVDISAPGNEVFSEYVFADWDQADLSAKRFNGAARWSGTSFSAPLVTALLARERAANGAADWDTVLQRVKERYRWTGAEESKAHGAPVWVEPASAASWTASSSPERG